MATNLKDNFFKATREIYGDNSVKYNSVELNIPNEKFEDSKTGFDWGNESKGAKLLAFAILKKISSPTIARVYENKYTQSVIKRLKKDIWSLEATEVAEWINTHTEYSIEIDEEKVDNVEAKEQRKLQREKEFQEEIQNRLKERESKKAEEVKNKLVKKRVKEKVPKQEESDSSQNIIKIICQDLDITYEELAEILNVTVGTIKEWRLENEIPHMASTAIDFYKLSISSEEDRAIHDVEIEKYQDKINRYEATIQKHKTALEKSQLESKTHKEKAEKYKLEIDRYKELIKSLDIPSLYKKYNSLDL